MNLRSHLLVSLASVCLVMATWVSPSHAQGFGTKGGGGGWKPSVFHPPGASAGGQYIAPADSAGPNTEGSGSGSDSNLESSDGSSRSGLSRDLSSSGGASRSGTAASGIGRGQNSASSGGAFLASADAWTVWWETNKFEVIDLTPIDHVIYTGQGLLKETAEQRELRMAEMRRIVRDAVLPTCRELTSTGDAGVRAAAIVTLGKLYDSNTANADIDIARTLLTDANVEVRRAAMLSLGIMNGGRASYLLMNVAHDSPKGQELLDSNGLSDELRGTALLSACLRGDQKIEMLVMDMLSDTSLNPELLAIACEAAGLAGSIRCQQLLIEIAIDPEIPQLVRSSAAIALGRIGQPTSTPSLMHLLDEDDLDPKRAATIALGLVGYPGGMAVIGRLGKAMSLEKDAATRHLAAISLGRIGGDHARGLLRDALKNAKSDMKPWIALGMGIAERKDASTDMAPLLIKYIASESNADTLSAFAIALGLTKSKETVPLLTELLHDGTDSLKGHAALALGLTSQPEARNPLRDAIRTSGSPFVLRQSSLSLGILGDTTVIPDLVELIRVTPNPFVASFAAIGLALLGNEEAAGPLMALIDLDEPHGIRTTWAVAAVGQLLDANRKPALSRLAANSNYYTRTAAVDNLLALGF